MEIFSKSMAALYNRFTERQHQVVKIRRETKYEKKISDTNNFHTSSHNKFVNIHQTSPNLNSIKFTKYTQLFTNA